MTAPVKSRDMIAMLRRHYLPEGRPPAGIFAPEIRSPDGRRRADLIWASVVAATGDDVVGHEVKVTRADLLSELSDPAKSDPWQRHCHRWWLVVPDPALLDGLTIPRTWGVMCPPSGRRTRSMTVHVPAPALHPTDQADAWRTLATWLHWQLDTAIAAQAHSGQEAEALWVENGDLRARLPKNRPAQEAHDKVVSEIVRRLGGVSGSRGAQIGDWSGTVDIDDVVEALRGLAEVRERARYVASCVDRDVGELRRIMCGIDPAALAALRGAAERCATATPQEPTP